MYGAASSEINAMSTGTPRQKLDPPTLNEGQRLDQPAFHSRYESMPPGTRAELIGGAASTPSPVGLDHSDSYLSALVWLAWYAEHTPGIQVLDNATVILSRRTEAQPDAGLRVRPEDGGRTRNEGRSLAGPPELVVEVSRSSRDINLGPKRDEYEQAGILEYVVRDPRGGRPPPGRPRTRGIRREPGGAQTRLRNEQAL